LQTKKKPEKFLQSRSIARRKERFDPDIWLIELDVASAERFAAEMNESV
jgi:hypothetical protein